MRNDQNKMSAEGGQGLGGLHTASTSDEHEAARGDGSLARSSARHHCRALLGPACHAGAAGR